MYIHTHAHTHMWKGWVGGRRGRRERGGWVGAERRVVGGGGRKECVSVFVSGGCDLNQRLSSHKQSSSSACTCAAWLLLLLALPKFPPSRKEEDEEEEEGASPRMFICVWTRR